MLIKSSLVSRQTGFTLIEAVVVLCVVLTLLAILLPAIQGARNTAHLVECKNNLKQIGLGLANYEQTYRVYPPSILYTGSFPKRVVTYFSVQTRLLANLDQAAMYNAVNFACSEIPLDSLANQQTIDMFNSTVYQSRIQTFVCPSDSAGLSGPVSSYRGNAGIGPSGGVSAERPDSGNGCFSEQGTIGIASIVDGLSNTSAFSERLIGDKNSNKPNYSSAYFISDDKNVRVSDQSLLKCRISARYENNDLYVKSGSYWFWTGRERTLYNHTQSPNGGVPDCFHGSNIVTAKGMATARSRHSNGVNVLMADGSVVFVTDGISQMTWRSLGSRNGGEFAEIP